MRYHFTSTRKTIIKMKDVVNGKDVGEFASHILLVKIKNSAATLEKRGSSKC